MVPNRENLIIFAVEIKANKHLNTLRKYEKS